jgi:hypothetical protein
VKIIIIIQLQFYKTKTYLFLQLCLLHVVAGRGLPELAGGDLVGLLHEAPQPFHVLFELMFFVVKLFGFPFQQVFKLFIFMFLLIHIIDKQLDLLLPQVPGLVPPLLYLINAILQLYVSLKKLLVFYF